MRGWLGLRWLRLRDWWNWHAMLAVPVRRSRLRELESDNDQLREDLRLLIQVINVLAGPERSDQVLPPSLRILRDNTDPPA